MFIPLNDTEQNRYGGPPLITLSLIAINVMVLIGQQFLSRRWLFLLFGSVPAFLMSERGGGALASITSTFLHADIFHLLGNMIFLYVFGRRLEDACGPWRFLVFYLICGLFADLLSTMVMYDQAIPSIGASGAISGVLGAYMILFPGSRIRTFLLLGWVPLWPRVRAFWFLLFWIGMQIVSALEVIVSNDSFSTNYFAHLGGFFAGVLVVLFLRPEAFSRFLSKEPV